jgi:hypothetical protein
MNYGLDVVSREVKVTFFSFEMAGLFYLSSPFFFSLFFLLPSRGKHPKLTVLIFVFRLIVVLVGLRLGSSCDFR